MNQNFWRGSNPPFLLMTTHKECNDIEEACTENAVYLTNQITDSTKKAESGAQILLQLRDPQIGLTYRGRSRPMNWLKRIASASIVAGALAVGAYEVRSLYDSKQDAQAHVELLQYALTEKSNSALRESSQFSEKIEDLKAMVNREESRAQDYAQLYARLSTVYLTEKQDHKATREHLDSQNSQYKSLQASQSMLLIKDKHLSANLEKKVAECDGLKHQHDEWMKAWQTLVNQQKSSVYAIIIAKQSDEYPFIASAPFENFADRYGTHVFGTNVNYAFDCMMYGTLLMGVNDPNPAEAVKKWNSGKIKADVVQRDNRYVLEVTHIPK